MKIIFCLFLLLFPAFAASAQTGVLIPLPKDKPDEKMLSIDTMNVSLCVDNQTATVQVTQIYENHTAQTLEGKFVFALPETAAVSDFAVWDGAARIPGVMMERRRANEIYGEIKARAVDPGILQMDDEAGGKTVFSARVFPIPPFGTKRVEISYTQNLALENFSSHLVFPLKSSYGEAQRVRNFSLNVCAYSEFPFTSLNYDAQNFPLQISKQTANEFAGEFQAENYVLNNDFSIDYSVKTAISLLSFIAFRAPEQISAFELRNPALAKKNADGYFEMRAVFNENSAAETAPRRIVLLVDTSLSMYGEKLARAVESAEFLLRSLNPADEFNLVLFGNEPHVFSPNPVGATPGNIENALDFLKNSNLDGGTNLKKALEKSVEIAGQFSLGEKSVVFISDANPTRETLDKRTILSAFDQPQTFVKFYGLVLGSDADTTLFNELAKKTGGFYAQARETEDISPLLEILLSKIGSRTIENLDFSSDFAGNFYEVYRTGEHSFDGSSFSFVGRYRESGEARVNLKAIYGAREINLSKQVSLPELDDFHAQLPRLWARARIDWLVKELDLNGEREDFITEIIALSQKYRLVSPYTAFIAAPRALLRPRLIQPGDPVIRVKTDDSITQVFAVLPFGETLPLEFLKSEGVWETRFLAPAWMADGAYNCRLLLTDKNGNGFEETKTFVVDSQAPEVKINLAKTSFQSREEIEIRASADKDTAKLTAKFYGAKPVQLVWSDGAKASVGKLVVPSGIAPGQYVLTVSAEDFAHNQSSEEIRIEILGN
jgi:Ca-activated chloride channel family protein